MGTGRIQLSIFSDRHNMTKYDNDTYNDTNNDTYMTPIMTPTMMTVCGCSSRCSLGVYVHYSVKLIMYKQRQGGVTLYYQFTLITRQWVFPRTTSTGIGGRGGGYPWALSTVKDERTNHIFHFTKHLQLSFIGAICWLLIEFI